jgi:hypothetical protein
MFLFRQRNWQKWRFGIQNTAIFLKKMDHIFLRKKPFFHPK